LIKTRSGTFKGSENKSHTFVSGVLILTVSGLLVKIAGLLFKIPMNYIVGDTGMGYYNSAYSVYTLFYMLSTSGLPVAMSVMISEKRSVGRIKAAKLIYKIALWVFLVIGLGISLFMLLCPGTLASLIRSEKSALSIAYAAPTVFFICVASAIRGYFQGCGNMVPTAVSQLIEAVGKLVFGVLASAYAVRMGYGVHIVAAYGVAGLTVGSFFGTVYLLIVKRRRGDRDLACGHTLAGFRESDGAKTADILKRFVKISFPITVSASVMSLTSMIDTALIQRILISSGMTEETAATLYGNYTSLAVPMFNLPPVLVYPIAYALVPAISAAFAAGERNVAAEKIQSSLRYAVIIGLPCALGLTVLADPILCLFYKEASAHMAAPLLVCLAPSSFFVCILAVTNSVLQACGQEKKPVVSMLVGALVKCVSSVFLLSEFGISGAPISTFMCYFAVTVINFAFVVKHTGIRLRFRETFLTPLLGSVLSSTTALVGYKFLSGYLEGEVCCVVSILLAAIVYAGFIYFSGAVDKDEILALLGRMINKKGKRKLEYSRTET